MFDAEQCTKINHRIITLENKKLIKNLKIFLCFFNQLIFWEVLIIKLNFVFIICLNSSNF